MREKIHTDRVILVEGKYDAARLAGITDATILCTDGFGIYRDGERQKMLRQLARKNGLLIFTDSDAAGFKIRNFRHQYCGGRVCAPGLHPGPVRQRKTQGGAG